MALAAPLETATPANIGLHPQRTQHLVSVLRERVAQQHIPGAVVLVARQGQVGLLEAVGQQNPTTGTPMRRSLRARAIRSTGLGESGIFGFSCPII